MAGNGHPVGTLNGATSGNTTNGSYPRYDLTEAARLIDQLHRRVIDSHGRVEIVRRAEDGADDVCVLISKAELDCIERALDILGDSECVKELCGEIALLASRGATASSTPTL